MTTSYSTCNVDLQYCYVTLSNSIVDGGYNYSGFLVNNMDLATFFYNYNYINSSDLNTIVADMSNNNYNTNYLNKFIVKTTPISSVSNFYTYSSSFVSVATSYSGKYIFGATYNIDGCWLSTNYGVSFSNIPNSVNADTFVANPSGVNGLPLYYYSTTKMDKTGQYMLVTLDNYYFFYSTNYGTTWKRSSTTYHIPCGISYNGNTTVVALRYPSSSSTLVISTNYMVTWSTIAISNWPSSSTTRYVSAIGVSGNGTTIIVAPSNNTDIFISNDKGTSFTIKTSSSVSEYMYIGVSYDGSKFITGRYNGSVLISTNSGTNISSVDISSNITRYGGISATGKYMAVFVDNTLYISNNYGNSFTLYGSSNTFNSINSCIMSCVGNYITIGTYSGICKCNIYDYDIAYLYELNTPTIFPNTIIQTSISTKCIALDYINLYLYFVTNNNYIQQLNLTTFYVNTTFCNTNSYPTYYGSMTCDTSGNIYYVCNSGFTSSMQNGIVRVNISNGILNSTYPIQEMAAFGGYTDYFISYNTNTKVLSNYSGNGGSGDGYTGTWDLTKAPGPSNTRITAYNTFGGSGTDGIKGAAHIGNWNTFTTMTNYIVDNSGYSYIITRNSQLTISTTSGVNNFTILNTYSFSNMYISFTTTSGVAFNSQTNTMYILTLPTSSSSNYNISKFTVSSGVVTFVKTNDYSSSISLGNTPSASIAINSTNTIIYVASNSNIFKIIDF